MNTDNNQDIIEINTNESKIGNESVFDHFINLHNTINGLTKIITPSLNDFSNSLSNLSETIGKIMQLTSFEESNWKNLFKNFHDFFSDIIQAVSFPGIEDDKKQELIDSYTKWGKLGWTINPCDEFDNFFDICPKETKSADKLALEKTKNMDAIINCIRSKKRVKKSDFEEAVNNFNDRRYKSCALILFSLIDGKLIRFSGRSKEDKKIRPCGKKAIEVIKQRIGFDYEKETLFMALFCVNLFACIEKMFENGNDFKNQPDIINRNFICHGMLTKRVTRKDCIQLFLLYYNILELSDMVYER